MNKWMIWGVLPPLFWGNFHFYKPYVGCTGIPKIHDPWILSTAEVTVNSAISACAQSGSLTIVAPRLVNWVVIGGGLVVVVW